MMLNELLNILDKDENIIIYNIDLDDVEFVGNCKEFISDVDINVVEICTTIYNVGTGHRQNPKVFISISVVSSYYEPNYNAIC